MGTKRPWRVEVRGRSFRGWRPYETRSSSVMAVATCRSLERGGYHTAARVIHRETGEIAAQWPEPEPVADVADLVEEMRELHEWLQTRALNCAVAGNEAGRLADARRLAGEVSAYNYASNLLRSALERCGVDLD